MPERSPTTRTTQAVLLALRHYRTELLRDWRVGIPALLLPGVGSIFAFYVPPLLIAEILGDLRARTEPAAGRLVLIVGGIAATLMMGEMLWRLGVHFLIRVELRGTERLYVRAMDELLAKDLAFFHDNFAGSLTKRAIGYSRSYEGVLDTLAFQVFASLVPIAFVAPVLWALSPILIAILLGMLALTLCCIVPLIRRRQALVATREEARAALAGHMADSISNMDAVRSFAQEPHEAAVHRRNVRTYIRAAQRSWDYQNLRVDMVTSPLYVLTNAAGLVAAIALSRGDIARMEAVFITFTYFITFTRVMWEFNQIYRHIETYLTEAAQFTELLLDEPTVVDVAEPEPFHPRDPSISFRGVRFQYHERGDEPLFEAFDLEIPAGQKVGLVGRSGGGKSTVTRLLLRLRDVDEGQILIGGQDISQVAQADLRAMISSVPQDPVMFHRSLMDNIRFGRLDVPEEEVFEAARLAHATEFIERLPNGYDTLIGERGVKLSGGQRQRVAIARAMLKGAPILVLDEATSSLDSDSERLIQDALWTLMEGRTTIVIAHRLSTVQRMDRLIVLEQGRIVEEGTHAELLARGGIYAELWAHQSGGFLAEEIQELAPAR